MVLARILGNKHGGTVDDFRGENRTRFRYEVRISVLVVVGLSLVAAFIPQLAAAQTAPSPLVSSKAHKVLTLDGSGSNFCINTTVSCLTVLSTSKKNDLVIAFAIEALDLQVSCTFSISDSAGLSWASRVLLFGNSGRDQIEEFWSTSANQLTSDAVTESISGCGSNYNGLIVFGISGADLANPFDPNPSLPGAAIGFGTTPSVTISTSHNHDMIIGMAVSPIATPGSGFTLITQTNMGGDSAEYQIVRSKVTGLLVTFSANRADNWLEIADAIQSA